jgi:DNA-binding response OmpR family regulator
MIHPSILIVEDDGLIVLRLQEFLKKNGYTIPEPVPTGEEAIESAGNSPPDLVLMDIRLAGKIDGIEAARIIREHSGVPVIFLTAHSEIRQLDRVKQVKPAGYIMKPFIEDEVLAAIGKVLKK